jgi:hypothetical protein
MGLPAAASTLTAALQRRPLCIWSDGEAPFLSDPQSIQFTGLLRGDYSVTYCSRIGLIPSNISSLPRWSQRLIKIFMKRCCPRISANGNASV